MTESEPPALGGGEDMRNKDDQNALADQLRDGEALYRALTDALDQGFCTIDVLFDDGDRAIDYRFVEVNSAFAGHTGLPDAVGKTMRALHPQHESFWFETYGDIALTGQSRRFEHEAAALSRWFDVHAFRVGRPAQRRVAVLFEDVTERHAAEERQRLLLAELQHRVRNTLAVVRAIARRTAQNSGSVEEMGAHLEGRLDAFARVQAMVTRSPQSGVDLVALIEDELLVHATREGEHLKIEGPDVMLVPKSAETMSLAIHELTTNAVKYGALGDSDGRVRIGWRIEDGRLEFSWEEELGLGQLLSQPSREGFGLELLKRVVPYELSAETRVEFRPEGLHFTLSMPLTGNLVETGT